MKIPVAQSNPELFLLSSESEMFQTIAIALTTVTAHWERQPRPAIYAWLFELCLLPRRKEVPTVNQHVVLEHLDDHLVSIEHRIRDKNASERDRQLGRDDQNRYIQSMVDFFRNHKYSSQYVQRILRIGSSCRFKN